MQHVSVSLKASCMRLSPGEVVPPVRSGTGQPLPRFFSPSAARCTPQMAEEGCAAGKPNEIPAPRNRDMNQT